MTSTKSSTGTIQLDQKLAVGLIAQMPLPIVVFDEQTNVLHANPASYEVLRCTRSQLVNLRDSHHVVLQSTDVQKGLDRLIDHRVRVRVDSVEVLVGLGQPLCVDVVFEPLLSSDVFMMMVYDFTVHDRLREAGHSGLMNDPQSADLLVRGLMHEINNPLGGIRAAAQMLAAESSSELGRELADGIVADVDRVHGMLDNFRDLGLLRTPELEWTSIQKIVLDVVHNIRLQFPEIHFDLEIDMALPAVQTDPGTVGQILTNLVLNAAQFSVVNPPSVVRVTMRSIIKPHQISARMDQAMNSRSWLRIEVEDTGPGFGGSEMMLFRPFFTTRSGGTGLGLALSRAYAQQLGGRIEALASARLGGALFRFEFPVVLSYDRKNR